MVDEYIRLDTTIMGIDGLINEAPTGSQARALLCAKDMIYDQQRYVSEMEPVKRGHWIDMGDHEQCSECKVTRLKEFQSYYGKVTRWEKTNFCPNCGADMRSPEPIKG